MWSTINVSAESLRGYLRDILDSTNRLVDGTIQLAWRDGVFRGATVATGVMMVIWMIALERRKANR